MHWDGNVFPLNEKLCYFIRFGCPVPVPNVPGDRAELPGFHENETERDIAGRAGSVIPALYVEPGDYSGVMTRCESGDDGGYILSANFRRSSVLFTRSFLRRSISFPIGSLNRRM